MFGVLNFVKNLVFGQEEDDFTKQEEELWKELEEKKYDVFAMLQAEETARINESKAVDLDVDVEDLDSDSEEQQYSNIKEGTITAVKKDGGVINNVYICRSEDVLPHVIQVGDQVHFRTVINDDSDILFVKVESIVPKDVGKEIYVMKPGELLEKTFDLKKRINGKITDKTKSSLVIDGTYSIDLSIVTCDLILEIGDLVDVECLVNPSTGDVVRYSHIKPTNVRLLACVICHYNEEEGIGIVKCDAKGEDGSLEVPFKKTVCKPGYLPLLNDEVLIECIQSDLVLYQWRAVNLALKKRSNNPTPPVTSISSNGERESLEGLTIKTISENVFRHKEGWGQVKLEVRNTSVQKRTLMTVKIDNQSRNSGSLISQLKILRPQDPDYTKLPTVILSNNYLTFTFGVNPQFYGKMNIPFASFGQVCYFLRAK